MKAINAQFMASMYHQMARTERAKGNKEQAEQYTFQARVYVDRRRKVRRSHARSLQGG